MQGFGLLDFGASWCVAASCLGQRWHEGPYTAVVLPFGLISNIHVYLFFNHIRLTHILFLLSAYEKLNLQISRYSHYKWLDLNDHVTYH